MAMKDDDVKLLKRVAWTEAVKTIKTMIWCCAVMIAVALWCKLILWLTIGE